jgi:hypothetical protein
LLSCRTIKLKTRKRLIKIYVSDKGGIRLF